MNKNELRTWLEQHSGEEWEEERMRMIEANKELSAEILRDVIISMCEYLSDSIDQSVETAIENQLETMEEFPDVKNILKKF